MNVGISPRGHGSIKETNMNKQLFLEVNQIITNNNGEKVKGIKGIRAVSGCGLKEAKELFEDLMENGGVKTVDVPNDIAARWYSDGMLLMREAGITVTEVEPSNPARLNLAEQIRSAGTYASLTGQYDIAHALIDFLAVYFPAGTDIKEENE